MKPQQPPAFFNGNKPTLYYQRLLKGDIVLHCLKCDTPTFHIIKRKPKYLRGFSPDIRTYYACDTCGNPTRLTVGLKKFVKLSLETKKARGGLQ